MCGKKVDTIFKRSKKQKSKYASHGMWVHCFGFNDEKRELIKYVNDHIL